MPQNKWTKFAAAQRRKGLTFKEAGMLWRAKKTGRAPPKKSAKSAPKSRPKASGKRSAASERLLKAQVLLNKYNVYENHPNEVKKGYRVPTSRQLIDAQRVVNRHSISAGAQTAEPTTALTTTSPIVYPSEQQMNQWYQMS